MCQLILIVVNVQAPIDKQYVVRTQPIKSLPQNTSYIGNISPVCFQNWVITYQEMTKQGGYVIGRSAKISFAHKLSRTIGYFWLLHQSTQFLKNASIVRCDFESWFLVNAIPGAVARTALT